jgi:FKBP-type peptidyl-prolyl cis-trans isomerase FklB
MRLYILCFALALSTSLFAQSKKELLTEVDRLKKEAEQLKTEIEKLKKPKEVELKDTLNQVSYGIGTLMASNLKMQGGDGLNAEALVAGINDVFLNKTLRIDQQEAMVIVQKYMEKAMAEKANKARSENAAFLENNKKMEGVKTTASGLQYKVITQGKGKAPLATDKVTVHYVGKLIDGSVFDSSIERNEPITFDVNGVIPGWTEALLLMHEGDKWMLYIPHEIAYGERGAGGQIPPYSTLVFEVELIKVN